MIIDFFIPLNAFHIPHIKEFLSNHGFPHFEKMNDTVIDLLVDRPFEEIEVMKVMDFFIKERIPFDFSYCYEPDFDLEYMYYYRPEESRKFIAYIGDPIELRTCVIPLKDVADI